MKALQDTFPNPQTIDRRYAEMFSDVLNSSLAAIVMADVDGNITYVNPKFTELTQYSAEEAIGKNPRFLQSGQTPQAVYRDLWKTIKSGLQWRGEFLNRRKDGTLYWERAMIAGVRGQDGEITGYFAVKEDITEVKLSEQALDAAHRELNRMHQHLLEENAQLEQVVAERTAELRRVNQWLTTTLNSSFDAIVILTPDGKIEGANQATTRVFGYEVDELLGRAPDTVVDPTFRTKLISVWTQVRQTGKPQQVQGKAYHKNGTPIECDFAMAVINGNGGHVVCSVRDITMIQDSQRLKDRFVSMVNHELRQPISSLLLSAGKINTYYDRMTDQQRKTTVDRIYHQTMMMNELVESILDLSRLDSRSAQRVVEPVDVAVTALNVLEEMSGNLDAKRQILTTTGFDAVDYCAMADPLEIKRIWRNLISNANKYTPDGGTITVRVGRMCVAAATGTLFSEDLPLKTLPAGDYIVGQIEDTGSGIPPEDMKMLFSRFHRGWAAQSGVSGTGLGLALVRELLTTYKGAVGVSSVVGQGSIFTFCIPAAKRATEAAD